MHLLELRDVAHRYEKSTSPAITDLSFTLDAGQVIALVGPSGSGKTTVLTAAGLLMRPTQGEVLVEGRPTSTMSEADRTSTRGRSIGFLFQESRLIRHLTVLENVVVPLLATGRSASTQGALELLEFVGLSGYADRLPGTLSGGQAQRVAFCRALVRKPAVVLADEPTASLDSASADGLRQLLDDVVNSGVAVLLATHDREMVRWAGSTIELDRGHVSARHAVAEGTVS